MPPRHTYRILLLILASLHAALVAEGPRKFSIEREQILRAVRLAKEGDRKELGQLLRRFRKLSYVKVSKKLRPDFEKLLADEDSELQLLAAKGLFLLKQKKSRDALVDYLSRHNYPKLMKDLEAGKLREREYQNVIYASMFAITTLGEIGDESVVPLLESLRGFKDFQTHFDGAPVEEALAKLGPKGFKSLARTGRDDSSLDISNAVRAIQGIRNPKMAPALVNTVKEETAPVEIRRSDLSALGEIKEVQSLLFILSVMKDAGIPKYVRAGAAYAAAGTGRAEAELTLLELLAKPQCEIRVACLLALNLLSPEKHLPKTFEFLLDKSASVKERENAARQLRGSGYERAQLLKLNRETLKKCLQAQKEDGSPLDVVRMEAWMILNKVTGEEPKLELGDWDCIGSLIWYLKTRTRRNILGEDEQRWVARKLSAILVPFRDSQKLKKAASAGKYPGEVKCAALAGLASRKEADTLPFILAQARNPDHRRLVRGYALEVAAKTGLPAAEGAILKMLKDPKSDLRSHGFVALASFNSEKYYPALLKAIMNTAEPLRTRYELAAHIVCVTRENPTPLKPYRDLLVQGLKAKAAEPHDQDSLRVYIWITLYRAIVKEQRQKTVSPIPIKARPLSFSV